jgi:SAM-dependent methyltransferase
VVLARIWNIFTDLVGTVGSPGPAGPLVARVPAGGLADIGAGPAILQAPMPLTLWGRDRIAVVQSLWGDGFIFPDGEEETLRLAKPLALSNASSLLLLGAGAGGPPCCIATQLGAWVTGFEMDPDLATVATEHSARGGLGRRAEIKTWEPAEVNFSRRSFHHALSLEALRGQPPGPVLVAIFRALRPGGQFVMVDLVADEPLDPADDAVNAWCRLEGRLPAIPSQRAISGALGRLGFDIRVTEDISLRHMQQALGGWHGVIRGMAQKKPGPTAAMVVVREAELWLRRLSLMRAHRIRLVRWHAIRGAAPG